MFFTSPCGISYLWISCLEDKDSLILRNLGRACHRQRPSHCQLPAATMGALRRCKRVFADAIAGRKPPYENPPFEGFRGIFDVLREHSTGGS